MVGRGMVGNQVEKKELLHLFRVHLPAPLPHGVSENSSGSSRTLPRRDPQYVLTYAMSDIILMLHTRDQSHCDARKIYTV